MMRIPVDRAQLDAEIGHAHPPLIPLDFDPVRIRPRVLAYAGHLPDTAIRPSSSPFRHLIPEDRVERNHANLACPSVQSQRTRLVCCQELPDGEHRIDDDHRRSVSGRPTPTRFVALSLMTELLRNVDDAHFAEVVHRFRCRSTAASVYHAPAFVFRAAPSVAFTAPDSKSLRGIGCPQ